MTNNSSNLVDRDELLSLYDYLKKPAGSSLGKQVAAEAKRQNIGVNERAIETKTYKGTVLLYPYWFLHKYFNPTN